MVYSSSGASSVAAAQAALAQAVKASGTLVRVEPDAFLKIIGKNRNALVITAQGGFMNRGYQYLTSYKGIAFFTKSITEISLPGDAEIVAARQIWMPY
jgi:hypothetical protein